MNASVLYTADPGGVNPRIVGIETPIGTLGDAHMDALSAVYYDTDTRTANRLVVEGLLGNLERVGLVRRYDHAPGRVLTVRMMRPTPLGARIARQL